MDEQSSSVDQDARYCPEHALRVGFRALAVGYAAVAVCFGGYIKERRVEVFDFVVERTGKTPMIVGGFVEELAGDGAATVKKGLCLYDVGPWLMLVRRHRCQEEGSREPLDNHELLYKAW